MLLTDKTIQALKPKPNRQEIADTGAKNLYIVVQPSGSKSWAYRFSLNGKGAKLTFGGYPAISLREARKLAGEAAALVEADKDPRIVEKERKAAEEEAKADTVAATLKAYDERRLSKKSARTRYEQKRILKKDFEKYHADTPVTKLRRRDYADAIQRVYDRGATTMANRFQEALSGYLTWLADRGILDVNPIARMEPLTEEEPRDRVLDLRELRLVWLGAVRLGGAYGDIVRALILSGQRKMEVGAARFSEFKSIDNHRTLWTIPKERVKTKVEQRLIIPAMLADIFLSRPVINFSDLAFTTTGEKALWSYSKAKRDLDAEIAKVAAEEDQEPPEAWTFHDLRRTAATHMGRIGVDPYVVELVLNHAVGSRIARTYNKHDPLDLKEDALLRWSVEVERIVRGADVIPFKKETK
ncbi:Prophage CP4-57 integrase [Ensifer adhaerens]|uniref:tyrosine-type recombinase/integrase n=1 Tax=Ensifer adhaerens TaxID=106592 RepID=UPI00156938DC|nr:integrase arm-type DNA-binding domain-containing protein [Ensifer adhaerens]NRP22381.1 Prophage CP4-57 integrase [Ensifer adhaerens]